MPGAGWQIRRKPVGKGCPFSSFICPPFLFVVLFLLRLEKVGMESRKSGDRRCFSGGAAKQRAVAVEKLALVRALFLQMQRCDSGQLAGGPAESGLAISQAGRHRQACVAEENVAKSRGIGVQRRSKKGKREKERERRKRAVVLPQREKAPRAKRSKGPFNGLRMPPRGGGGGQSHARFCGPGAETGPLTVRRPKSSLGR